jgi:hypothetical protein
MNSWEKLRTLRPLGNPFRLQGLIKLGEAYEKASDVQRAVAVYEDLARNAPQKEVAKSAAMRAQLLRKSGKVKTDQASQDAPAADEATEPKQPGKKKANAGTKKGRKAAAGGDQQGASARPADDESATVKVKKGKSQKMPGMDAGPEIQ